MPVAIVLLPGDKVTAFYSQRSPARLLRLLRGLFRVPELQDVDAAKVWLQTLREPSGWFDSIEEADEHLKAFHRSLRRSTLTEQGGFSL